MNAPMQFKGMTHEQRLEWVKNQPWTLFFVGSAPEGTEFGSDYKLIMGLETPNMPTDECRKRYERIDEIGNIISIMEIPLGWIGIDKYNYDMVDHVLDELLKGHPNRCYIPRIHMDAPEDWMRVHPEELCVYWNGPTDPKEIAALVCTDKHDLYGCVTPASQAETIGRQSFSSQVWLEDACEALSRFIDHLENGPYADQIIGYMPMFGNFGENMLWGDWRAQGDPRRGDFGISHKKHFYDWVINKYGSLEELRKAWHDPELTYETFRVPTPPERWSIDGKDLRGVLLADDQRQVDCNDFHSAVCFDAVEAFGKVVKDKTGKLCGAFYAYTMDETVAYGGHLAIDRALNTPYVDFYSSPKGYHYCLGGDPGTSQAPGQSIARKKLWIEENDMRSWHAIEGGDPGRAPKSASDTFTCFWRELYRALTFNQGFWWMDINHFNDDWYADEDMVNMFKQMDPFYRKWAPVPRKRVAEVLFVEDEESCAHMTMLSGAHRSLRLRLERELRLCGVPVDHFRVADLLELDLSQYKFIVFQHAFVMPAEKWGRIRERIRPDAHILWNYAAGLLAPAFNSVNQKIVTGFNTVESPGRMQPEELYRHVYWHSARICPQDYPLLEIVPEAGQEVLQSSPDGKILTARIKRDRGANIYATEFTLRTPFLRRLLEDAQVKCYAPQHCTVLADEKLIGFFPRYDVSFPYYFEGTWRNVLTGEIVSGAQQMNIREKKLALFERVD